MKVELHLAKEEGTFEKRFAKIPSGEGCPQGGVCWLGGNFGDSPARRRRPAQVGELVSVLDLIRVRAIA